MLRTLLALTLSLLTLAAAAQVYRHVDEEGNVTFTDQPPAGAGAEPVEIRETNTSAPPPVIARPVEPPRPSGSDGGSAYEVRITAPADETIIPNGPGNFSVSASIKPALAGGDVLQLRLNGEARGEPQTASSWALTNVFRGEQNITVAVLDADGDQLAESEPVTVFVFRPSTNNNNAGGSRPGNPGVRPPRPTPFNR